MRSYKPVPLHQQIRQMPDGSTRQAVDLDKFQNSTRDYQGQWQTHNRFPSPKPGDQLTMINNNLSTLPVAPGGAASMTATKKIIIVVSVLVGLGVLAGGGAAAGVLLTQSTTTTRASETTTLFGNTTTVTTVTSTSLTTVTTTATTATTSTTSTSITSVTTTTTVSTTTSTTSVTTSTTTSGLSIGWNGTGTTVAGITGSQGTGANQLWLPYSIAIDSSNRLFIADRFNHRIQRWAQGATSGTTVAGQANGVSGSALNHLNQPCDVLVDSSGNLYISDTDNHRVMFYTAGATSGTIIAGTGVAGTGLNQLDRPHGLARDSSTGTLYIADFTNNRIMRYTTGASSGTIVAGGNGAGTANNQLNGPIGVAFDPSTNSLLIPSNANHHIVRWMIGASTWTLVAGTIGSPGTSATQLCNPTYVKLDSMLNLYVGDRCNHRIQFFPYGQSTGTTIAGNSGVAGATATTFDFPSAAVVDAQFNIYVADNSNQRIQRISRF